MLSAAGSASLLSFPKFSARWDPEESREHRTSFWPPKHPGVFPHFLGPERFNSDAYIGSHARFWGTPTEQVQHVPEKPRSPGQMSQLPGVLEQLQTDRQTQPVLAGRRKLSQCKQSGAARISKLQVPRQEGWQAQQALPALQGVAWAFLCA